MSLRISGRIADVCAIAPREPALQFDGTWRTWDYFGRANAAVCSMLDRLGLGPGARVGVLMRNQPEIAASIIGLLCRECCVVTLSTAVPGSELVGELEQLRLPAVVAAESDLDGPGGALLLDGCRRLGVELITVSDEYGLGWRSQMVAGAHGRANSDGAGVAVEMLTSGTTGRPKRVNLSYRSLELEAESTARYRRSGEGDSGARLSGGVTILWTSLLHIAGVRALIESVVAGRRVSLLRRFDVGRWTELVHEHRPTVVFLVPAAMQMIMDAGVPRDVFSGIVAVFSGSAPLDPARATEFTRRYGPPVLQIYGATEFAGGVAGWTLKDWKQFGGSKEGSVGRANEGIEMRVVDPASGAVTPSEPGLLELRGPQLGSANWVRTTDLARIDDDGFLYIMGRADDVIIRGGLKVHGDEVAGVLRRHADVRDAIVLGVPDPRLGAVPVAAVEREPGSPACATELAEFARRHLAAYQVPARIEIVDQLPRTPSMKVSKPLVIEMLGLDRDPAA